MKLPWAWFVAAAGVTAIVLSACGGTSSVGLPYHNDFSSDDCEWKTQEDERVSLGCADGAYHVLVKDNAQWYSSHLRLRDPVDGLSVEADATVRKHGGVFGVACWGADGRERYSFLVTPLQEYAIRREIGDGLATSLESGKDRRLARGNGTRHIRADCLTGGGVTVLTLYVDGTKVATTTHQPWIEDFAAVGVDVNEVANGTEIVFDNVAVRRLSTAELSRARKQAKAWGEAVCGAYESFRRKLEAAISQAESVMYPSDDPRVRREALVRFYTEATALAHRLMAAAKQSGGAEVADAVRSRLTAEFEQITQSFEVGKTRAQLLPSASEERFNSPWLGLLEWSDLQAEDQAHRLRSIHDFNEGVLGGAFTAASPCEPIREIFGDY
jgi:hypothetical protein